MKCCRILAVLLILALFPMVAQATTYTYTPYDNDGTKTDVFDLDHNYLYIWGIKASIPSDEVVVGATISIKNINNWDNATNILKFYLVDNPKISDTTSTTVDIISIADSERTNPANEVPYYLGTKFTNYATLTTFTDTNGTGHVNQFSYAFNTTQIESLSQYLGTANPFTGKNANFGIAFDPDCHYYNDGITLTLETRAVPEPATLLFLGFGLVGLAGLRRKFRK